MEMERQRQTHSKEIENKDEEVEEIRRSCSKKVCAAYPLLIHLCKCSFMHSLELSGLDKAALRNTQLAHAIHKCAVPIRR